MRYIDESFLMNLKDYLDLPINKVMIYINNKLEYTCYKFDRIYDMFNYIHYDKLNIRLIIQDCGYSLELILKKEEGEENE